MTWDENTDDDVDIRLIDNAAPVMIAGDTGNPPGDSPAELSALVSEEMDLSFEVYCSDGIDIEYVGELSIP